MLVTQAVTGQINKPERRSVHADTSLDAPAKPAKNLAMSKYLRAWRKHFVFTLKEVSAKIGIHWTAIQKWETGVNAVGMPELEMLGKAYDVPAFALTMNPSTPEVAENLIRVCKIVTQASDTRACNDWIEFGEKALLGLRDDPESEIKPKRRKR